MTNRIRLGYISVSEEDMVRYRELRGELGFSPNLINGMESPNLVMSDLKPETQERILTILNEMTESRDQYLKERTELQQLLDYIQNEAKGHPYLRDLIRGMSRTIGYVLDSRFNIPVSREVGPYQSYRVAGINRINDITDYIKCVLTFLVDHWDGQDYFYINHAFQTIHDHFHKARLDFGYDNVYIDLTEKDTIRITGMYKSSENGEVVKNYLKLKLTPQVYSVERE